MMLNHSSVCFICFFLVVASWLIASESSTLVVSSVQFTTVLSSTPERCHKRTTAYPLCELSRQTLLHSRHFVHDLSRSLTREHYRKKDVRVIKILECHSDRTSVLVYFADYFTLCRTDRKLCSVLTLLIQRMASRSYVQAPSYEITIRRPDNTEMTVR